MVLAIQESSRQSEVGNLTLIYAGLPSEADADLGAQFLAQDRGALFFPKCPGSYAERLSRGNRGGISHHNSSVKAQTAT